MFWGPFGSYCSLDRHTHYQYHEGEICCLGLEGPSNYSILYTLVLESKKDNFLCFSINLDVIKAELNH